MKHSVFLLPIVLIFGVFTVNGYNPVDLEKLTTATEEDFYVCQDCDLSGADLVGFSKNKLNKSKPRTRGIDWRGANLSRTKFNSGVKILDKDVHGSIEGANFSEATLPGAKFGPGDIHYSSSPEPINRRADAKKVTFNQADLIGAQFVAIDLEEAKFENAKLGPKKGTFGTSTSASFEYSVLIKTNFKSADLTKAKFEKSVLIEANFEGAILEGATFEDLRAESRASRLGETVFSLMKDTTFSLLGAGVRHVYDLIRQGAFSAFKANFKNANLKKAKFNKVNASFSNFDNAQLQEADFKETFFDGTSFVKADLTGAKFSQKTKLMNVDFKSAIFKNANLINLSFEHVKLQGADLSGANLVRTIFKDVDLERAKLNGADLRKADLQKVRFQKVDLTDADLREANLKNADFKNAILNEGTKFKGANLQGVKNLPDQFIQAAAA